MIAYDQIRSVHLEISSRCNARCPDCPRNFFGVNIVDTYPQCDLRLEDIKKIFEPDFIRQLKDVTICGNYGDFVTARDGTEVVEYFFAINPQLRVVISTNASAKPAIWQRLGCTPVEIQFRLDGLKDTHHLYRIDTDWDLIIANAKSFIDAGGHAIWSMIVFDHNEHQIEQCRAMSEQMGFRKFDLVQNDPGTRNRMPVFGRDKKLQYVIGGYDNHTDFEHLREMFFERDHWLDMEYARSAKTIRCKAMESQMIYVTSNGEVYPCCWLGFAPLTNDTQLSNLQLRPMIQENNAIDHGLRRAIQWFDNVARSWSKPSVQEGRIYNCNQVCGCDND